MRYDSVHICIEKKENNEYGFMSKIFLHQLDATQFQQRSLSRTIKVHGNHNYKDFMSTQNFFNDMQTKINQVLENSPAKDIEKNVKAMMSQGFAKLDLVTREEFDIQTQVLAKTRAKLDAMEARVAELETKHRGE